jgi:acetolactate decarboxylase
MAVDDRLIGALCVETLRRGDRLGPAHDHEVFQTSTFPALLDGRYDGDVTFAELSARGDLGLGTFDACDGEMIALDGEFLRADVDGVIHPVDPQRKTPFAAVIPFAPTHRAQLTEPHDRDALLAAIDRAADDDSRVHAVRIDGRFELVRARSVPAQRKPYPPLAEVAAQQNVFDLHDVDGTMVGFAFPAYAATVNVPGYHLHFVTADRSRGGHVLDCRTGAVEVAIDCAGQIELELPAGVELPEGGTGASADAVKRIEGMR